MELVAVPRADDVHVVLVEGLAEIDAVLADQVDHLRHTQPLAGRSALVRAEIAIGVVFSGVADDADLDRPGLASAARPPSAISPSLQTSTSAISYVSFFTYWHLTTVPLFRLSPIAGLPVPAPRNLPSPAHRRPRRTACRTAAWRRCRWRRRCASAAPASGSSIDGSDGPAGMSPTMMTSLCGCTRNAIAHSTSADECTSMSGSTMVTHFGRMLLDIAAEDDLPRLAGEALASSRSRRRTTRRPTRAPTRCRWSGTAA